MLLQFDALVETDFVQPGEAEAKKERLAEKKRQAEADKTSRKRKKGASAADVVVHVCISLFCLWNASTHMREETAIEIVIRVG